MTPGDRAVYSRSPVIRSKPTSLDLFLARAAAKLYGASDPTGVLTTARLREPDPLPYFAFLMALGAAWATLFAFLELGWLALWGAMYELHLVGHGPVVPGATFIGAFCSVGAVDLVWRYT